MVSVVRLYNCNNKKCISYHSAETHLDSNLGHPTWSDSEQGSLKIKRVII